MNGSSYLLDTVIVAAYFNEEAVVDERLKGIRFVVSSITIGELYYGAYNSQRIASNLAKIQKFAELNTIAICDEITGNFYGRVKKALKIKGRPIPENDMWIAATALQYNLILVSRDVHFREVDSLRLETW
jgi:tRNA(fMet)-specific endonuclease VapC